MGVVLVTGLNRFWRQPSSSHSQRLGLEGRKLEEPKEVNLSGTLEFGFSLRQPSIFLF